MAEEVTRMPNPMVQLYEDINKRTEQFHAALPAHIPVERFKRVLLTAIQNEPKLATADRRTFFTSAMKCAQDGLIPDGRDAALVIYNTKLKINGVEKWVDAVQYLPMVAGVMKKVRNSGEIANWAVYVVHEQDKYELDEGFEPHFKLMRHVDSDPGKIRFLASLVTFKDKTRSLEIMAIWEIERIKVRSKVKSEKGPWTTDYEEMCKKTIIKRHSKRLPMSTDLDDLIRRDDDLYNMEAASDKVVGTEARRPQLMDFSEAATGEAMDEKRNPEPEPEAEAAAAAEVTPHNPETGEILDKGDEAVAEDYGPPEAMAAGRKARDDGIPKRAPAEFRDNPALQSLAAAWLEGWMNRDKEIEAEAKAAKKK